MRRFIRFCPPLRLRSPPETYAPAAKIFFLHHSPVGANRLAGECRRTAIYPNYQTFRLQNEKHYLHYLYTKA
jgi:hypothetical protein